MDIEFRKLLKEWQRSPTDEAQEKLDAYLKRRGWPSIDVVRDMQIMAREILSHTAIVRFTPNNYTAEIVQRIASLYQNMSIGAPPPIPSQDAHWRTDLDVDTILLGEFIFTYIGVHPTSPEHASRLNDPEAYHAAVRQTACEYCKQYFQGCICDQFCRNCERLDCICDAYGPQYIGGGHAVMVHEIPALCGCSGSGWHISDFDSIHRCNIHEPTCHRPECYEYDAAVDAGEEPPHYSVCSCTNT